MQRRTFLAASAATLALPLAAKAATATDNPVLAAWTGPHGGYPAFDKIKVEHFLPALETAMAQELAEVDKIAGDPAPPTFENTIAALERSGAAGDRAGTLYSIWTNTLNSPEMQAVQKVVEPKLAAHSDKISQNTTLFRRIEAVYEARDRSNLTPEQKRLAWLRWNSGVRAGAKLEPAARARVAAINAELADVFTAFNQNLLADEQGYDLFLTTEADLAGLPSSIRANMAADAKARGKDGQWVIVNTRSSMEPVLAYSDRRDLREKVWRTYYSRGDNGDARDNNANVARILKLRAERAKLLGFPTHAHWRTSNAMAKTPEAAMGLMTQVWNAAIARVDEEVADMQAIADQEGARITIEPWDYRYYAEKVRKAKYDLDMDEVKPYLQLEKLREAMFWASGEIYGFRFAAVNVPVAHPDIRAWEVTGADGKRVGLWYFDPYARPGKRSGAWMGAYRTQQRLDGGVTTIVSNNCNFVKGADGAPVLVSWDDATTLFHEFGHAIHGLCADAMYPSLSGTRVSRDYVEFPSQINEYWLSTPQVLNRFALHYETGKPIPAELVAKIKTASTFNQGFDTTETQASALIDMLLHLAGDADIDPDAFEREELAKLKMPKQIVMRHRTPQFYHAFGSDNYSAGYYSYLWADVLTADVAEAFAEAPDGFYDKALAKRLRDTVMSKGNTVDPAEQFRAFRGRDPDTAALMRDRGFPVTT